MVPFQGSYTDDLEVGCSLQYFVINLYDKYRLPGPAEHRVSSRW